MKVKSNPVDGYLWERGAAFIAVCAEAGRLWSVQVHDPREGIDFIARCPSRFEALELAHVQIRNSL